jgi:hypothetical protein
MRGWIAVVVLAACGPNVRSDTTPPSRSDTRARECPRGGRALVGSGVLYCLATCEGALEDDVSFSGMYLVARYDDGLVFAATGPRTTPDEVCRALPHGCACTTPACQHDWLSLANAQHDKIGVPPRCLADDPECGPEAFDHGCIGELGYRPGARRVPITQIRAGAHDDCDHDGECVASGAGPPCNSTRKIDPHISYINGLDHAPPGALCGCIDHACALFSM